MPTDVLNIRPESINTVDEVYPFIAEKLPLLLGHDPFTGNNNVIDRPIYLPALDVENGVAIDPAADTTVTTDAIAGASVFVAAGSLETQSGDAFTGELSITEVPRELTPAALPENLLPDLVVTIQPGEMVFTSPAPLTLPNRGVFAPGTQMDLWSINPNTGDFEKVGKGQVSADGSVINTVEGGIRNSSWHLFTPFNPLLLTLQDPVTDLYNLDNRCSPCRESVNVKSNTELHSGGLLETHDLASYQSQGLNRGFRLTFDGLRADPRPIVHFSHNSTVPIPAADDFRLVAKLSINLEDFEYQVPGYEGKDFGFDGGEHFWRISQGFTEVDAALQADLSFQKSGVYQYSLRTGFYQNNGEFFSGTSTLSNGELIHINTINSSFGAGWGLSGLQELVEQSDGSVLLIDGDGSELLFKASSTFGEGYISPAGDFSTLEKLEDGRFRRTLKDQVVYTFNADNKIASMVDPNGNTNTYTYNGIGQLIEMTDPVGLKTTLTYTNNRVTSITDPANRVTRMVYDNSGNLIQIIDSDGSIRTFEYSELHHLTAEIDKRGSREEVFYDFAGRVDRALRKDGSEVDVNPVVVKGLLEPTATIDPFNAPVAFQLSNIPQATNREVNGNLITTDLDQAGKSRSASDAIGKLPDFERDENNLVLSTHDALKNETTFRYDDNGNLLQVKEERPQEFSSTVQWIGESGSWHNPDNWSTGQIPTFADTVLIDVPGDVVITSDAGFTVTSILSEEHVISTSNFTVVEEAYFNNGLTFSGATLSSPFLVLRGENSISPNIITGTTLINQGFVTFDGSIFVNNSELVNQGTVLQNTESIITFSGPSTLSNGIGATYELQDGKITGQAGFFGSPPSGIVRNSGIFRGTGTENSSIDARFINNGVVDSQDGILTFNGAVTDALGSFQENGGSIFIFWRVWGI